MRYFVYTVLLTRKDTIKQLRKHAQNNNGERERGPLLTETLQNQKCPKHSKRICVFPFLKFCRQSIIIKEETHQKRSMYFPLKNPALSPWRHQHNVREIQSTVNYFTPQKRHKYKADAVTTTRGSARSTIPTKRSETVLIIISLFSEKRSH